MELTEALRYNSEIMFCEVGNRFALDFIAAAQGAILGAMGAQTLAEAETATNTPLRKLYFHFANCPNCQED